MPEAVIVSAARSPIGRANKGSLKDLRPDDLTALDRPGGARQGPRPRPAHHRRPAPRLRPARRRARQQHGPRRHRADRHGRRPRRHDHPLLLLVGADHPDGLPRDQGRRGRRLRLRRRRDRLPLRQGHLRPHRPTPATRVFDDAEARTDELAEGGQDWHDPREDGQLPDVYIAMGQTAENVARLRGLARQELDEFGVRSQNLAEKAIDDGFWAREITPVTAARRHRRHDRRRPPRRA